ncbi:uncharacterized protein MONBRDRAFT_38072 [Monosiga brevicollis MX1]|uniref:RING-type domain-containing protein n=1 Tax=Monosiga brevicollis TaxID=81824 RepID=A9V5I2_MONBE|nr:uncharacterized protein MONBRDRAFT_38072 [Monosiga brevicollis MX1]EDQ87374.1 predicted protein [Monosiga brevicollis MX1]|eukprot:XP_001747987.1 hypothetical protein [Monosiga brevicollis MX1]
MATNASAGRGCASQTNGARPSGTSTNAASAQATAADLRTASRSVNTSLATATALNQPSTASTASVSSSTRGTVWPAGTAPSLNAGTAAIRTTFATAKTGYCGAAPVATQHAPVPLEYMPEPGEFAPRPVSFEPVTLELASWVQDEHPLFKDLICSVCLDFDGQLSVCSHQGQHIVCNKCQTKSQFRQCPVCRCRFQDHKDNAAQRILATYQVSVVTRCVARWKDTSFPLAGNHPAQWPTLAAPPALDLCSHLACVCQVECPWTKNGCTFKGPFADLQLHVQGCFAQSQRCRRCKEDVQPLDLHVHARACGRNVYVCTKKHCGAELIPGADAVSHNCLAHYKMVAKDFLQAGVDSVAKSLRQAFETRIQKLQSENEALRRDLKTVKDRLNFQNKVLRDQTPSMMAMMPQPKLETAFTFGDTSLLPAARQQLSTLSLQQPKRSFPSARQHSK